jgi:moderate conductance mechanosensitive channel
MDDLLLSFESWPIATRIITIAGMAIIAHFVVRLVQLISERFMRRTAHSRSPLGFVTQQPKFVTLTTLFVSAFTFTIYFLAFGFVLAQFGLNLTAYLATASVIGLAVGFGSQGLVQDVVIGITLIFSDTFNVGDIVEVSGQIGRVERVGLRFTRLINFHNQEVFIPNRIIAVVSRFRHSGIYAYADVQLPAGAERQKAVQRIEAIGHGMWAQFNAIILEQPEFGEIETVDTGGWNFLRVRFKVWPGQGALIETVFRPRAVAAMKEFDPNYTDWMVNVTYRATTRFEPGVSI